jgi:hypothetical protein
MLQDSMSDRIEQDKNIANGLPHETILPSSFYALLSTVLGMLALLFLVNIFAVWYLHQYTPNRGYWLIKEKWNLLLGMNEPVDWLILGDSTGNSGIAPSTLKSKLGGKGANLCTISLMLVQNDVWMLENYIARFGRPQNVLMVYSSEIWQRKFYPAILSKIPLEWGFWSQLSPKPQLGLRDKIEMLLYRYAPLYAERDSLSKVVIEGVKDPRTLFRDKFRVEQDGFMRVKKGDPDTVESHMKELVDFARKNHFQVSEINRRSLE